MIKEKKIDSKLAAYSMLAAGVLAFGTNANGQVVYTDINPDQTFTTSGGTYNLDLNNDATPDFKIILGIYSNANSVVIIPDTINGNEALGATSGNYFLPFALNANDPINAAQAVWNGTKNVANLTMAWLYTAGGNYGYWLGATDQYLGLRFKISGQTFYGWARLDVNADVSSFTIKDYAYQSTVGTGLLAGEGISGIQDNRLNNVSIYSDNKTIFLNLNGNKFDNGTVTITNVLGQELKVLKLSDSKMEINLFDQNSGVYIVTVTTEAGSYTRKIHLK